MPLQRRGKGREAKLITVILQQKKSFFFENFFDYMGYRVMATQGFLVALMGVRIFLTQIL